MHRLALSFAAVLVALVPLTASRDGSARAAFASTDAALSPDYDLARTGIEWRAGLDAALNRGKPVLLFQLLGDFAKVHC